MVRDKGGVGVRLCGKLRVHEKGETGEHPVVRRIMGGRRAGVGDAGRATRLCRR